MRPGSVTVEFTEREHQLITPKEFEALDFVRSKYKHNRTFYCDERHIVIKEIPTAPHSRAATFMQATLAQSIMEQLLLPNYKFPHNQILLSISDECNEPPLISPNP